MDWSEFQNWDEYTKLLIGLLALADPIGVIPVVLGLTKDHSIGERKKIVLIATLTFVITLVVFTYLGVYILDLFGIDAASLRIAGGILFLFYALEMLGVIDLPKEKNGDGSQSSRTSGIVPIGIPMLAGPGTISAIVIYAEMHATFSHKVLVNMVAITAGVLIYLIFRVSLGMGSKLGSTTIPIMTKVMGLILAAISIEFILDGIVAHFPDLISIH